MNIRSFIGENDAARAELKELVSSLDERSYGIAVGSWTIGTALCHLAFWDQRVHFLLKEWERNGKVEAALFSAQTVESVNHAVNTIGQAVPGPAAGRLVLDASAAVDSHLAGISEDFINQLVTAGLERYLRRSLHRREHLVAIRKALAARVKG